ncbi:MAG: hypothetical protein M1816_006853 [Peltula sp. TS41687]|nr:MAG: hypothetical protein M1816_006853 [Peltula sp. TS41687]
MAQPNPTEHHVLIIGAGIVGLTLAQALRKQHPSVRCTVYERDPDPTWRGAGWGLTIHWALTAFRDLLPQELVDRFEETFVDPEASRQGKGNFLFFDLRKGASEPRWKVPPADRIRVRRESLRRLLMEGVEIEWSKNLTSFTTDGNTVTAQFADFSSATGTLLVGCDGTRSKVRQLLCPDTYRNTQLPVRLLGVSARYPAEQAEKVRALDPFFFQGGDPGTDAFLYFSFLTTPSSTQPDAGSNVGYTCQIITSWPYRPGFLGALHPLEVPATNAERLAFMKRLAAGWAEPIGSTIQNIPADAVAKVIALEDWPPPVRKEDMWDNRGGKVTLAGDAAHAMVMFRGEAANHGVVDVSNLVSRLRAYLDGPSAALTASLADVVSAYEAEMIQRTRPGVMASRRACLDAVDYKRIDEKSPLVSRRAVVPDDVEASVGGGK